MRGITVTDRFMCNKLRDSRKRWCNYGRICNRADYYIFALCYLSVCLSVYLSIYLSKKICLSVCLSVYLSISGHHRTTSTGYIFATKARINNRKKNLLSSNTSSTCPYNTVNFGPLAAEIRSLVWCIPSNFNGFASWQHYCMASSSGRQPTFAALNRGRHLCSAGRPSRWALAHILVIIILMQIEIVQIYFKKRREWLGVNQLKISDNIPKHMEWVS